MKPRFLFTTRLAEWHFGFYGADERRTSNGYFFVGWRRVRGFYFGPFGFEYAVDSNKPRPDREWIWSPFFK